LNEKRDSQADVPNWCQQIVIGFKMCADTERKCCEPRGQLFDLQCLVARLHVQLQESPGPPAQRNEFAGMASPRQKFVLNTSYVLSFNLISIALFAAIVDERFRISQSDRRAPSATDRERRIRSGQM